jgi:hypothetical protein
MVLHARSPVTAPGASAILRSDLRSLPYAISAIWQPFTPSTIALRYLNVHGLWRAEVTANTCFGTADKVRAHVAPFFAGLGARTDEVKQRCRTALQSRADALDAARAATTRPHDLRKAA